MFALFFEGVQEDFLLALIPPVICALFRLAFIMVYAPRESLYGGLRRLFECFRYGFWWGMDVNAYVFLALVVLVSIPAAFIPSYLALDSVVRLLILDVYCVFLYLAFMGKMIFYYHFHDTFNSTIKLGGHADKKNLADIFFNQHHGGWIILGIIPYLALCSLLAWQLIALPEIAYWKMTDTWLQYVVNFLVFGAVITFFYWLRYGGTLNHRKKPEWDDVPELVKKDVFLGKAAMDDLVALKLALHSPVNEVLTHSDEEAREILAPVILKRLSADDNPLAHFRREAKGARITPPKHIFLLMGESHAQAPLDPAYEELHLMDASKAYRAEEHTVSLENFLSAGMNSRPSLVSLSLGIFDAMLELNERKLFWEKTVPIAMARQLNRLGYRTEFWYGGALNHGSMEHFMPAAGFNVCHAGPDFVSDDAPRTWLGIYDHIFLEAAAKKMIADDDGKPVFHFVYTTSNHGPYNMPFEKYGFDIETLMPDMAKALRWDKKERKRLGSCWYADQALMNFLKTMREAYPDSLFVVTGDHTAGIIPYGKGPLADRQMPIREQVLTTFAMSHPQLTQDVLAGNTLGGHMNILPTIIELVAPKGFEYYSIVPPLTEHQEHVVTPYCWMTADRIGSYASRLSQQLEPSLENLPVVQDEVQFEDERDAWCELTGWMVRHPELLDDAGRGKRV